LASFVIQALGCRAPTEFHVDHPTTADDPVNQRGGHIDLRAVGPIDVLRVPELEVAPPTPLLALELLEEAAVLAYDATLEEVPELLEVGVPSPVVQAARARNAKAPYFIGLDYAEANPRAIGPLHPAHRRAKRVEAHAHDAPLFAPLLAGIDEEIAEGLLNDRDLPPARGSRCRAMGLSFCVGDTVTARSCPRDSSHPPSEELPKHRASRLVAAGGLPVGRRERGWEVDDA
jgi:hypothetical protein